MKNIYFAQLYHDYNGHVQRALASDGVVSLDGRMTKENMKQCILDHVKRHKAFHIGKAVGYSLHYGTYSNNRCIQACERF